MLKGWDTHVHQQPIDLETIKSYLEDIRLHQRNQENLLEQIRLGFPDEIEKEVEEQLRYALQSSIETTIRWNYRSELDNVIRSEVSKQVEEQVNAQIVEHIPVGLQQQAEESNKQVRDIMTSLTNSWVMIMIIGAMLDIQNNQQIANHQFIYSEWGFGWASRPHTEFRRRKEQPLSFKLEVFVCLWP